MSPTYEIADHQQVSTRVVEVVADREGIDPIELTPPLHESVNPDALDTLFAPITAGERRGQIEFTYRGYRITLSADGERTITVEESSQPESERRRTPAIELGD